MAQHKASQIEKFYSRIDEEYMVDLAKRAIETASPTGEEEPFAELLVDVFADLGLEAQLQTLYEGRSNAVARLKGQGVGPHLLLSGHLDTSVRGDENWLVGPGWKNVATIDGRTIWGNGIFNMKGAFVCYATMLQALRSMGVTFEGDLIVAGTCGEIELGAIDEFVGRRYDSQGVGLRYLLQHGVAADYHILGEPTGLAPHLGHMGSAWAKVTTFGSFTHTAWSDQATSAIDEMWCLSNALSEWIEKYRRSNVFMGVTPQVNRAAVRGGHPWRAARTANYCSLYVDIRFPPDVFPIDIQREFSEEIRAISADVLHRPATVEWYMTRPGALIRPESPVVEAVVSADESVRGIRQDAVFGPPWCSDAIDSNRLGIPTVLYGLGGTRIDQSRSTNASGDPRSANGEYVTIDDMVVAAKVYGLAVMELMSGEVSDVIVARRGMPSVDTSHHGGGQQSV